MKEEEKDPFEVHVAKLIKQWMTDEAIELSPKFKLKSNECIVGVSSIHLIEAIPGFEVLKQYNQEKVEYHPRIPSEWGRIKTDEGYLTIKTILGEE